MQREAEHTVVAVGAALVFGGVLIVWTGFFLRLRLPQRVPEAPSISAQATALAAPSRSPGGRGKPTASRGHLWANEIGRRPQTRCEPGAFQSQGRSADATLDWRFK
jgi:hypothetical protein